MTASTSTAPPVSAATYGRIGFRVAGVPLGGPITLDAPESPQLGDVLPPLVDGHGPLTVRHRAWRHDGASLVLVVEATCREVRL